jgi:hypothetical protein
VFVSVDDGASWQSVGQGLPNAPVVKLQLDLNQGVLAAATQGRSVFTIQIDDAGPHVTTLAHVLTDNSVTVTFNEAIDPNTFGRSVVTLTGPNGFLVSGGQLAVLPVSGDATSFTILFPFNVPQGAYTITITPTVTDLVGNEMDQNQNAIQGEIPDDIYNGRFIYQPNGNFAPVLGNSSVTLPQIIEDGANPGVSLTTIINNLNITDGDLNALKGIAITGIPATSANADGTWQYSRDNGATWASFITVTPTSSLLLENAANNLIRFLPNVEFTEDSIQPSFQFRAWDLTSGLSSLDGSDGGFADTTVNGGIFPDGTAFSTGSGTASMTVLSDNPTFTITQPQVAVLPTSTPIQFTLARFLTNISAGPIEPASTLAMKVTNDHPTLFTAAGQPKISMAGTLTFTPIANVHGVATVTVKLSAGDDTTVKTFTISVNHLPVLQTIPDQSFPHTQTSYSFNLEPVPGSSYGSDADNDPLTFSATVAGYSTLYEVQYGSSLPNIPKGGLQLKEGTNALGQLSYLTNSKGFQEKWLVATNQFNARYFLLINGDLYRWNGTNSLLSSTLVASLGPDVYNDPTLLTNVQLPAVPPISASVDNANANRPLTLTLTSPFAGKAKVTVTLSDGLDQVTQTFLLTVTNSAPALDVIPQQQMSHNPGSPSNPLAINLNDYGFGNGNTDGDPLQFQTQVSAFSLPYELQFGNAAPNVPQGLYLFKQNNTYVHGPGIPNSKWLRSATDQNWYFIRPNGALYRWVGNGDKVIAHSTKIATLDKSVYLNPTLLTAAQAPSLPAGFTGVTVTDVDSFDQFLVNTDGSFSGTVKISVQASDTDSSGTVVFDSVARSFQLDVSNLPPTIAPIPDQSAAHGGTSLQVDLTPYITDPDLDTFTLNEPVISGYNTKVLPPVTVDQNGNVLTFTLDSDSTNWAGTFQVTVTATDPFGATSAPRTFLVIFPNSAPTFNNTLSDQVFHHGNSATLDISATDSDGDGITYSATVQQAAFSLSLRKQNYGGQNEKWVNGPVNQFGRTLYFITQSGQLWAWNGMAHQDTGALVAQLDASVWDRPTQLTKPSSIKPVDSWVDTTTPSAATITPDAGFAGIFQVNFSAADGFTNGTTTKTIWVTVTNDPVGLNPIANQSMDSTAGSSLTVPLVPTGNSDNDPLTWTVTATSLPGSLQQTYGFIEQVDPHTGQPSFFVNFHGLGEKWVFATRGIKSGQSPWFCILPSGNMFEMVGIHPAGKFIGAVGTTIYNDPSQLFDTASQPAPDVTADVTQDAFGNWSLNLTLNSDFFGTFVVYVTVSDGASSVTRSFRVN